MGIGPNFRNHRIAAIAVTVKPDQSFGRLDLAVNGKVVQRERLGGAFVIRFRPAKHAYIGRDLRQLELKVRGKAFIRDIRVDLVKPRRRHIVRHHDQLGGNNPWVMFGRLLARVPSRL